MPSQQDQTDYERVRIRHRIERLNARLPASNPIDFTIKQVCSEVALKNQEVWQQYRNNLARELIALSGYINTQTMAIMQQQHGHHALRLSFEPYMSLISGGSTSLSGLARSLGITKQAASKTVQELETLGYVARHSRAQDARSRDIALTAAGSAMLAEGVQAYKRVERTMLTHVDKQELTELQQALGRLCDHYQLNPVAEAGNRGTAPTLGTLLARVSDHAQRHLMLLTANKGHRNLRLSYAQVLSLLRPNGTRIQDIVRIKALSKQAVGSIANELTRGGYLERKADPQERRQQRLHLSRNGMQLIEDSVASVREFEAEIKTLLGPKAFLRMGDCASRLYHGLGLAQAEFGDLFDDELEQRARSLRDELGEDRARSLGRLLLS